MSWMAFYILGVDRIRSIMLLEQEMHGRLSLDVPKIWLVSQHTVHVNSFEIIKAEGVILATDINSGCIISVQNEENELLETHTQ